MSLLLGGGVGGVFVGYYGSSYTIGSYEQNKHHLWLVVTAILHGTNTRMGIKDDG